MGDPQHVDGQLAILGKLGGHVTYQVTTVVRGLVLSVIIFFVLIYCLLDERTRLPGRWSITSAPTIQRIRMAARSTYAAVSGCDCTAVTRETNSCLYVVAEFTLAAFSLLTIVRLCCLRCTDQGNTELIEERRRGFEFFLRRTVQHPSLRRSPDLLLFLTGADEVRLVALRCALVYVYWLLLLFYCTCVCL